MKKNTAEWVPYDKSREVRFLESGIVSVRPKEKTDIVPLFCLVCKFTMKSSNDYISHKTYGCCEQCELHFARPNSEKWQTGWRPESYSKIFVDYIEKRYASKAAVVFR